MRFQKLLSIVLAVLLIAAVTPLGAFVVNADTEGYYTYTISDDLQATITSVNTSISGNITIPSTLGGYPVKSIRSRAFSNCTGLTSIVIPDSVTSIGFSAFYGCSNLEEITIPFVGDKRHTPNDTYQYPFGHIFGRGYNGGTETKQYYYDSSTLSATYSTYDIPANLKKVTITDCEYIQHGAFENCTGLTSITIPDGVTSIGGFAFAYTWLKNITIPDSVTSIGRCAFYDCNISSVIIPDSVINIGESAFEKCSCLKNVIIGDGTINIGQSAFKDCRQIQNVTIMEGLKTIEKNAFYNCEQLHSINIPDGVTTIGSYAFYNCHGLSKIAIPDSVTFVGEYAFYNNFVASIKISKNIKEIPSYCFSLSTGLKTITIPIGVERIDDHAFSACSALTSISIPKSVSFIGEGAFWGCDKLKDIYYCGTEQLWREISIGQLNTGFYSSTRYYHALMNITNPENMKSIPDCEHPAIYYKSCSLCGEKSTEIFESGTALGHNLTHHNAKAPTCTEKGWDAYDTCSRCDYTTYNERPALGHDLIHHDAKAPTCTAKGWNAYDTCSRCDYTTYSEIAPLGHDYKAVITNPTCTEKGYTTHTCSRCKDSYVDTYVDALGHNWNNGVVTTEATCTVNGVKTYTCKHDNSHTYTEPIKATGHTEVIDKAVEPTCTATGLTEGKHCSACGTVLVAQSVVPALGHTMVNGKCSVCGYQAEKVKFPDVSYSAWYGNSVAYAVSSGLMKGYANGKFGTSDGIQRQDFVVILARLSGDDIDSYAGKSSFKDVPTNAYYAAALAWAKANGVSNGYNDGSFGVGRKVTREQIMTFLHNYAKLKRYNVTVTNAEKAQIRAQYSDFVKVSSYAQEATYWALKNGVISGKQIKGKRYISPSSPAQRCEVAAMFYNIDQQEIFAE